MRRHTLTTLASVVLLAAALGAALASCFSPLEPPCAFTCGPLFECPAGYTCAVDGLCHRRDATQEDAGTASCTGQPSTPDAAAD